MTKYLCPYANAYFASHWMHILPFASSNEQYLFNTNLKQHVYLRLCNFFYNVIEVNILVQNEDRGPVPATSPLWTENHYAALRVSS